MGLGHNELWLPKAAKGATKLAKISPNGKTELCDDAPAFATMEGAEGAAATACRLVHVVTSNQELPLCDLSNVVAFGYNDVLLRHWWLNSPCVSVSSSYKLMRRS